MCTEINKSNINKKLNTLFLEGPFLVVRHGSSFFAMLCIRLQEWFEKYLWTFSNMLTPFSFCLLLAAIGIHCKCCKSKLTGWQPFSGASFLFDYIPYLLLKRHIFGVIFFKTPNFIPLPILQLHMISFMLSIYSI